MKILDKYILKSFLVPFFATFFVILFVFVMQVLWLTFDDIAGKGVDLIFILKFLWYVALLTTPQALPVGVLLSSIMTLGNLSEKYEFAAAKSAGISLTRMVRPLVFLAIGLSIVNFLFLNNVYPYATLKSINLKMNIKKKQPALALVPGSFNTDIPNFHIKFDEKFGKEKNFLRNVMIYDLSSRNGNQKIITAKTGELTSDEGSRYMTLKLNDGYYFEEHIKNNTPFKQRQKMPASYATFKAYTINIDISSFSNDELDKINHTKNFNMLNLNQLKDTLPDLKSSYDEYIKNKAQNLYTSIQAKKLYKYHQDSIPNLKGLNTNIISNFKEDDKIAILELATTSIQNRINTVDNSKESMKYKRRVLNLYDVEFYNRVAFSLSCILLFFIGAPLGSIIRKGGMGLPMILAIGIYVAYFFSNTFGKKLAENSSVSAVFGSWISVIAMLPLAFILTRRAVLDKGLFDLVSFFAPVKNFFLTTFSRKKQSN